MNKLARYKPQSRELFKGMFGQKLIADFSARWQGNMSLNCSQSQGALVNRANFLESLGVELSELVCAKQIHSANIRRVTIAEKGKGALDYQTALSDTDALITNEKNLALAVFSADCLSIFLYDPQSESIGLVHAGWQGTYQGIVQKAVLAMKEEFGAYPENIFAQFGPAIRGCCYQVGGEFKAKFPLNFIQRAEKTFLDIAAANFAQLRLSKIKAENISDCGICTSCQNSEFFSFRKENSSSARMISVMMLN